MSFRNEDMIKTLPTKQKLRKAHHTRPTLQEILRGAWMAQLVKHLTLDFGSGHDLTVHEFESGIGLCADRAEPAWDSLSLPLTLCSSPTCSLFLSLSQNK